MTGALQPEQAVVAEFIDALFRYADGYISLRSFNDVEDGKPPIGIEAVKVGAPDLVDRICARIAEAATHPEPHVFCPPVCTFRLANGATTENLAEGIALTVECDANPRAAYQRLSTVLGVKPTATVASGGKWLNSASGKYEPKLHLHWRLKQPTRTAEEHACLREARALAAELVDADRSAVAIVHPIRWPGSWHRKAAPVIARLKTNAESEIHLGDALERLRKACPQATNAEEKHGRHDRDVDGRELRAPLEQIEAALGVIQNNASWKEWNRFGMAIWNATGGAGFAAFDRWSQKSAEYDAKTTADRWAHFFRSPPDRIGAGSIFFAADQARPGWRDEKRKQEKQGDSADQGAIDALARLGVLAYQKRRLQEAKAFGIPVAALDKLVRQSQARVEADKAELPHWKVEPWDSAVDGAELLTDIERMFTRYVFLPQGASTALALWTLHAWTMDAGDISPFLVLVSPTKRCGKTTVLIILYYLTLRSELASNISPSALFRYVEDTRPTLLIDEGDSFLGGNEELRGILNSGHTRTAAHVIRNVEINGEHKPRRFSTWAPKAIAAIRELADTLEDRAVVLMLQRKPKTAKVERLRKRDSEEFATLRRKAARWTKDNFEKLTDPDPDPRIPEALNDRAADNWRPLLAIADLACGNWPKRAREAACVLSGDGHDVASVNVELLADIRKAFGDLDAITSADLVAALVADPERPWATWGKGDKPLTQSQLARLLRPFGIISETVHPAGRPHAKGYKRAHFEEAWAAYCPGQNPSPQPTGTSKARRRASADEMGITSDFQGVRETSPHASKNANLSHSHVGLHARTFRNTESGDEGDSATASTPLSTGHLARVPSDYEAVLEELAARGEPTNGYRPAPGWGDLPPGQAMARVFIREVMPPALGPPGDDVFDLDPQWNRI